MIYKEKEKGITLLILLRGCKWSLKHRDMLYENIMGPFDKNLIDFLSSNYIPSHI